MPKQPRNFRLEEDVLEELAGLAHTWDVSQANVIERLIREAAESNKQLTIIEKNGERQ